MRKLAAVSRETQEYPQNHQSQYMSAPGITEEYLPQVSGEIEGRVTQKLSQEFSRTESRILSALSKLGEFLLKPQVQTFSGTVPGIFPYADLENQEPSRDCSQIVSHPEVEFCACRASNLTDTDPDETSHDITLKRRAPTLKLNIYIEWALPYNTRALLNRIRQRMSVNWKWAAIRITSVRFVVATLEIVD